METVTADILCTCGTRFSVQDDGNGAPHACPRCGMQNVLPRANGAAAAALPAGAVTVANSTRVLSHAGPTVHGVLRGLPPGTLFGSYRIERQIGRGGMGSVYEAIELREEQRVALKVLSPELAQRPDFVARFQRESRALSGLSDPRIAQVFFSGAAEGLPFFAMEFIDGRNLEQILLQDGRLQPAAAVHLMTEAAIGLSAAAAHGIIHRDVKPTNLLVDRDGKLRIVDFGLAKSVDSESRLTVTGAVVGTPYYLSPEQGLGRQVDERSDIYSLGATFYHLLAGDPPFEADSPVSIIMRHVNEAPDLLTERAPGVPEPLARVVLRCMAKDPKRRYQDWDELLEDLEAVRIGEPVSAPAQEVSVRRPSPSLVMMDDLDEEARVLRRASRARRAFALGLDLGLLAIGGSLAIRLAEGHVAPLFVAAPLTFLYVALADAFGGRSLGKRFFSLRVARPDGRAPGIVGATLRSLALLPLVAVALRIEGIEAADVEGALRVFKIDAGRAWIENAFRVLVGVLVIDLGLSLFTRRRETLHDLLSGTGVFREQRVRRKPRRRAQGPRFKTPRALMRRPSEAMHPLIPLTASVVPGLGQWFNGEMGKGLVFLIGVLVTATFPLLATVVWGLAAWEAWFIARRRWQQARRDSSATPRPPER